MKKLAFIFSSILTSTFSYAQVQGDISSVNVVNTFHDYDNCASMGTMGFMITIQNSFVNDTVKVISLVNGSQVFWTWNATGQTPWVVNTTPVLSAYTPDQAVNNNTAMLFFEQVKIICGPDTVFPDHIVMQNVPTPCTYGGVTGKIYVDGNNDCTFNAGDTPLSGVTISAVSNITNTQGSATIGTASVSGGSGDYFLHLQETWMTSYEIGLGANYQFIFPYASCSQAPYTFNTLPQNNVEIAVECADIDVSTSVYNARPVRPGVPFLLYPRVQNEGCDPAAGTLKLVLDTRVTYNPALSSNPPTGVAGDTLFWNYNNLSNLSNGSYWNSFISELHLTPDSTVNIGDTLCFHISSTIAVNDIDPGNNSESLCLAVVNSYDPNIKEVSPKGTGPEGYIPASTDELIYTIHFQNTGNAPAININVVDSLQEHVIPGSLRILASSHHMVPGWLTPNVVNFGFPNIYLADSVSNEPASHGFVTFKISLENGLAVGDEIKNKAHIYFDFNPAIITNTALNTIGGLSMGENAVDDAVVYPNPGDGIYNIKWLGAEKSSRITVMNITGQVVYYMNNIGAGQQIDISHLPAGMYILCIDAEKPFRKQIIKR